MRTLKANNYDQALKELEATDKNLALKLTNEIKERDSKAFNVVLVKKVNDVANERYLTSFVIQTYGSTAFDKIKKNFQFFGYSKIIVLHDPTKKAPKKQATKNETTKA